MAQQKSKKTPTWIQCNECNSFLQNKDTECHSTNCPPNLKNWTHNFVKDQILYGTVDIKTNDEIKNLLPLERDNLVFLSESVIKLCSLAIGEWSVVQSIDNKVPPVAKIVWPTAEKSLTSVLLTKSGLELSSFSPNQQVCVQRFTIGVPETSSVILTILNAPHLLEVTSELHNRLSKTYENRILTNGNKIKVLFYGKELKFEIKAYRLTDCTLEDNFKKLHVGDKSSHEFFKITSSTKWTCYKDEQSYEQNVNTQIIDHPAGVEEEIEEIEALINACLGKSLHHTQIKAVLLYGNSGTGKTSIAKYIATQSKANIYTINSTDTGGSLNSVEKYINEIFSEAIENSPSIIILDELDVLCPSRSNRLTESEKKAVSMYLKMFDDLHSRKAKVFVIATSSKPDNIDPAFRRCGRLDRELEISTPNPKSRRAILEKLLKQLNIEINEKDCQEISMNTHGFVGSDLVSLCSMASLSANRHNRNKVALPDFEFALKRVRPSAMREVQVEISNVKWSDIGGQEYLKKILKQAIEWPLKYPESFLRLGVTPPKGVLMFGPPGCSKTMIAKALACESGLNFLSIKGPELFSKWVGESERAVREVFRKARQVAPSIIFFDEIDALGGERSGTNSGTNVQERVLAQLLTELDGVTPLQDVTILAATNRPDRIDKALLRPGRLDRIVYVPLPDAQTRKDIFRIKFTKMPISGVNIDELVQKTENYSGAEVNAVCHEAAMMALEEDLDSESVKMGHFEKALTLVTPRTPPSLIELYENYLAVKI